MEKHVFTRVRLETERRTIRLEAKDQITPGMLRLQFLCAEPETFQSKSADDHVKVYLPVNGNSAVIARDFTPRAWDAQTGTLTIDVALHPHGPAVEWARSAKVGETLELGGPRTSTIVPNDFDWALLIGDSTALPSIGRRLESLPRTIPVYVIAMVADVQEETYLMPHENCSITWLLSSGNVDEDLRRVLMSFVGTNLPAGDGFIWIAAEESIARGTYRFARETLMHPKEWIKAAAYWSVGKSDGGARIA